MDINKTLELAPGKIAELASKAEDSRLCWKSLEIQLKQLEAKTHLLVKSEKDGATQSDIKAEVDASDKVYEMRMGILAHESEYKKATIECEKWINAFASARKLANLRIEEMRSLNETVKGGTK